MMPDHSWRCPKAPLCCVQLVEPIHPPTRVPKAGTSIELIGSLVVVCVRSPRRPAVPTSAPQCVSPDRSPAHRMRWIAAFTKHLENFVAVAKYPAKLYRSRRTSASRCGRSRPPAHAIDFAVGRPGQARSGNWSDRQCAVASGQRGATGGTNDDAGRIRQPALRTFHGNCLAILSLRYTLKQAFTITMPSEFYT